MDLGAWQGGIGWGGWPGATAGYDGGCEAAGVGAAARLPSATGLTWLALGSSTSGRGA